jgi:hypothetical protein
MRREKTQISKIRNEKGEITINPAAQKKNWSLCMIWRK